MKNKLPFKITENFCLAPADGYTEKTMRALFSAGEIVMNVITKTRKGWYNRYAHKLGGMCVENISTFENLDHHEALKRLQWESGAHCDVIAAMIPDVGLTPIRIPKSLSYGECSQLQYEKAVKIICRYICDFYWLDMTPEQVQTMAETMPDDV